MLLFLALFVSFATLLVAEQPDALVIVRRSLAAETENVKLATNYTYLQRTEDRELGPNGEVKSRRSKTQDVTILKGSTFRRLVERDDRPLSSEESKREWEQLRKSIDDQRHETDAQRVQHGAESEKHLGQSQEMIKEIPEAFEFRVRGEETIESRPAYIIDATPRAGYHPKNAQARVLLPNLKVVFWVDKTDFSWVRLDAQVVENISYGWFLVRLSKGAHLQIERTRVNNEVWLPNHVRLAGSARLALVKKLSVEQEDTYRDFKKFRSDSELVLAPAVK